MDKQLTQTETELLAALKAFVAQATKLSGFPAQYTPYVGALIAAKDAIRKVEAR